MSGLLKLLNSILGILAVVACLATVGIIAYSLTHPNMGGNVPTQAAAETPSDSSGDGEGQSDAIASPGESGMDLSGHVHDYKETVDLQPTCMSSGRFKYICSCGDYYFVDEPTIGHTAGDWETATQATSTKEGLKVKKCIYCDEIMAQETIPKAGAPTADGTHIHEYVATIESEPTCTVAGIRKYLCSCGSFYKENIHANGHLAGDWVIVKEATASETGVRQRICNVCHTLIDSRTIPTLPPTPTPSTSPLPSGATATPTATPSPTAAPTVTPHAHNFTWYVYKEATCTEKGIRTGNCFCGAEESQPIDPDPNNHKYSVTIIKPTATQKGYTLHICSRCGHSYTDNEIPATG